MKQADVILKNAYLVTMDEERRVLPQGWIAVTGDTISAVGEGQPDPAYQAERVLDVGGKVVFPGFISTHSHLFQTMLKGLGRDKPLLDWLNSSVRVALRNYDPQCAYYAALCGCIEAIRSGTTTILDYMYCHPQPGLDDQVLRAFEDVGIRGVLGRSFTNVAAYPPEIALPHVETEQMFLDEVRRLEKQCRGKARLGVCIAPGIIWDQTDDGFREMRKMADELHIPITMHLVETADDDAFTLEQYGERTIPHLERLGVLGEDFIAVHCVNMLEEDIQAFAHYGVKVSHNPVSNMVLASGVAPIPRMLEQGVSVSLACDGSASNDTQNMLEVLKAATLLQKVHHRDAALMPASGVLELATLGGAKALGREADLGALAAGRKADLIVYDPVSPWSTPVLDPVSSLVYSSTPQNIHSVMIGGRLVLEGGAITTVDEEKILRETQRLAAELCVRSGLGNVQWGGAMPIPRLGQ